MALGTDYLLAGHKEVATTIAFLIFENYDNDVKMKKRDLAQGGDRDVIRFYYRRAKCSCLKEMWKMAKGEPKMGCCYQCNERKERKDLMVCGACRIHQYCSKRCQREAWPRHQETCTGCKHNPQADD